MQTPDFQSRWLGRDTWGSGSWVSDCKEGRILGVLVLEGGLQLGWPGRLAQELRPGQLLWLNMAAGRPDRCGVIGRTDPEVLLLSYPSDWVRDMLTGLRDQLSPDLQDLFLTQEAATSMICRALEPEDRMWARGLMASTLCSEARRLLEGSRMSEFFFRKVFAETRAEDPVCTRTQRLALDRVAKVREVLLQDLENPPPLEELARLCGCHPHYLSRTFSEAAGMTISLFLRRLRIEKTAEWISSGRMNVSEAALEVGYRSLSHFSQAFRAEKGCSPSEWMRELGDRNGARNSGSAASRTQESRGASLPFPSNSRPILRVEAG